MYGHRVDDVGVRRKFNPLHDNVHGKRLVVVDDSIVRGTTHKAVMRMLREAGATEIHLRIMLPPWKWPCVYGIDTGTPIINPGEVAIVAFGTIKQKPWVVSGEVIPRWITTLGGSFDHRVVDGDLSARFMADVAAIMEEPALLLD